MYKKIENIYKKKSPYNILIHKTFFVYLVWVLITLFLNSTKNYLLMTISLTATSIITILWIKKVCEKVLNTKLYLNFKKKDSNSLHLSEIVGIKEKELFVNYLKENKIYNEKSIMCILNHYRSNNKIIITGGNLLSILSIILPIPLAFATKEGFDFSSLLTVIPYLISICIFIIIIYVSYKQFINFKSFIKGEEGMNERLEEIFSELYISFISGEILNAEATKKTKKVKQKKKK